jgi:hypothetical protein
MRRHDLTHADTHRIWIEQEAHVRVPALHHHGLRPGLASGDRRQLRRHARVDVGKAQVRRLGR